MAEIFIQGDDHYARVAVEHLVAKIINHNSKELNPGASIAVFIFEKSWVDVSELKALTACNAERILIIGNPQLLNFLSLKVDDRKMFYCEINMPLATIEARLSLLLRKRKIAIPLCEMRSPKEPQKMLNWKEFMIISLYISGISVRGIAGVMQLDSKTVYTYKSLAMRKMGLRNKVSLVRHWCHYH